MSVTVVLTVPGPPPAEYVYGEPFSVVVGRAAECGIRIGAGHRGVSRRHCRIENAPPPLRVRDAGSSFGTEVNGVRLDRLTERPLVDGDEIRVGDVVLRVGVRAAPAAAPPVAPEHGDALPAAPPGYELLRELGRGAQGVVYLARDRSSGALVALKRVLASGEVDGAARFAFRREFGSLRALRHPNIVAFRGGHDRGSAFWFACEYCPGGSLVDLLGGRGGRPLPAARAVPLALGMLAGLHHAHRAEVPAPRQADGAVVTARGLVHRDVKPANVLLVGEPGGPGPVVKLADFGLAKAFEHAGLSGHTRSGALGGTLPFTARAQLVDYKYAGPEVDVWATAACLYWLLTGTTPRDYPPDRDPVAVSLRAPVVPVRERDRSVPPGLAEVLDEALVDTPAIRVTTAAGLARALVAAAPGR
ncbi:protein kinase domain-containing protein [Streptomyces uncialis]|uniref:protein kinase domain-containing protein n=1 Tax=Streptomyces uncialis TaxID=1048205 RepID=UPI0038702FB9|nr:FHA domain-containing serine/threonine-protein kinase [Streptomyces uncialis]